jgi:hypothetical protein
MIMFKVVIYTSTASLELILYDNEQ